MHLLEVTDSANRFAMPAGAFDLSDSLIETIWGHRLWHRQTPWLILLEFLLVADALQEQGVPFTDEETIAVLPLAKYRVRKRLFLRYLLFRNPEIDRFTTRRLPDEEIWTQWADYFKARLPEEGVDGSIEFLKKSFKRFSDFAAAVKLLRETAVDARSTKKRASPFVFPFGPAALYEDLDARLKSDRTVFGRTGELLYMMLRRSGLCTELGPLVLDFLAPDTPNNLLLRKLQPPDQPGSGDYKPIGYLPYKRHPAFARLAQDWLSIRKLELPGFDAYQHYAPLAAFHVLLYHTETAAAWTGDVNVYFVCEVLAPRPEAVRQLSIRSFQRNESRARDALDAAMRAILEDDGWKRITDESSNLPADEQKTEALAFLQQRIGLNGDDFKACASVPELLEILSERFGRKLDDNIGQLHRDYGKACGFVNRRGTRSFRYAPTDSLLKTLVLANVEKRLELKDFLRRLYERYHLILGPDEADLVKGEDFEGAVFKNNAKRLEERLKRMGMLNRLSDGVAFVENPIRDR
jgi:hypothetical protein